MRRQLSYFALVLLIPILAFVGFVLFEFASGERARLEQDALSNARRIAVAVDRELANLTAALDVLAESPPLLADDLPAFHDQLLRLRERQGLTAVLRDLSGQQILNARVPFGSPLPRNLLEDEEQAINQGRNYVSNLFIGAVSGIPQFSVTVPILRNGERKYLLSLSLPVERIRDILIREQPSPDFTVAAVDRNGLILARNVRHADFVGHRAANDLIANSTGPEGVWRGTSLEGVPIFGAFARTTFSDWRIGVGVRDQALEAPLRRSLMIFATVGLGLAGLSLVFASLYARRIIGPMEDLTRNAGALGRGEPVAPLVSTIREVDLVGRALADASMEAQFREHELRDFNAALEREVAARTNELVAANRQLVTAAAEREKVEEQLRQAQKMEAVGQLTGGMAHDFNNLLAVIIGNLDILIRRIQQKRDDVERFAANALEAANRGAVLTHRLLAFSRRQPLSPELVDANMLIDGMSDLLDRALGDEIEIGTVLANGLWHTHADQNQLENALLNLAVNARDAMPGGGKLVIETANVRLDEEHARLHEVPAGEYVLIAVTDTGEGMTAETIARAFEPFFTTKDPGKGTGLGLSQVYGFVRQTGGHVNIRSEPGRGTTVNVYLPRSSVTAVDGPEAPEET